MDGREPGIRVLYLLWSFQTGGAEGIALNILKHFDHQDGFTVRAVIFDKNRGREYERIVVRENLPVVFLRNTYGEKLPWPTNKIYRRLLSAVFRRNYLKKQIHCFKPDLIHVHMANLAASQSRTLAKYAGKIPILYHMHSMPEAVSPQRQKKIARAFREHVYDPICVTQAQLESAKKLYWLSDCHLIYNGIDQTVFLQSALSGRRRAALRAEYGIGTDDFVIGCVARIARVKNLSLLIQALAQIRETIHHVKLLLVGDGERRLKEELRAEAEQSGVADCIIFAGNSDRVPALYRIMDVFALASFYESSSIVSVEAQLSGCPCVISNRVSEEITISDGVIRLSPLDTSRKWADAILAQNGRAVNVSNLERFSMQNSMKRLEALYHELCPC